MLTRETLLQTVGPVPAGTRLQQVYYVASALRTLPDAEIASAAKSLYDGSISRLAAKKATSTPAAVADEVIARAMLAGLAAAETISDEAWMPAPICPSEEEWEATYQAAFAEQLAAEEEALATLEAQEDATFVEAQIEAARLEGERVYQAFVAQARTAGYEVTDVGGMVFAYDPAAGVFYLDSDTGWRALTKRAVQALVNAYDDEDVTQVLRCSQCRCLFTAAKDEDCQACPCCPETPAPRTSRALRRVARQQRLHRKDVLLRLREQEAWEDWQAAESEVA